MTSRDKVRRLGAMIVLGLLGAAPAWGGYRALYHEGVRQADQRRWHEALIHFEAAIEDRPEAGGVLRLYGTRKEDYTPYFYLGLALFHRGLYAEALTAWEHAEEQRAVLTRRSRWKRRAMERLRKEVWLRMPDVVRELRPELEEVRRFLEELEKGPRLVLRSGEDTPARTAAEASGIVQEIEDALALLEDRIREARDRMEALPRSIPQDVKKIQVLMEHAQLLGAKIAEQRQLARQLEEQAARLARKQEKLEEMQQRLDRAEAQLKDGKCLPQVIESLHGLAHGVPFRPEPGLHLAPYASLSTAYLQCGRFGAARRYYDLARRRGVASHETLDQVNSRISLARREARALEAYDEAQAEVAEPGCRPRAVRWLQGPVRAWYEGWFEEEYPGGRKSWSPHSLLARAYLGCGLRDEAKEALDLARMRRRPPAGLRRLARRWAEAENDSGSDERRQSWLEAHRRARALVDSRQCRREAIDSLEVLLEWGWADEVREAGLEATPRLDLADAYLACGDLEQAEKELARAQTEGLAAPAAIAATRDALERRREQDADRRWREQVLDDYLTIVARVDLGICGEEVDGLLDGVRAALASPPAGREDAASGFPKLAAAPVRARARLNCGDLERAEFWLERARQDGDGDPKTIEQIEERLRQVRQYGNEKGHALLIAASHYAPKKEAPEEEVSEKDEGWVPLPEVARDAAKVEQVLREHKFQIHMLEDPASKKIEERVESFIDKYGQDPDSRLVIYYAGHGHTKPSVYRNQTMGYLVPVDAPSRNILEKEGYSQLFSMEEFKAAVKEIEAKHALFIFDSCFAGTIFEPNHTAPLPSGASPADLVSEPVRLFLTAGNRSQEVPDTSVFRAALVEGLRGKADQGANGFFLGTELARFVEDKGRTPLNEPQWGKMEESPFDRGDLGFLIKKSFSEGKTKELDTDSTRIDAELALWNMIRESSDARAFYEYLEAFPEPNGRFATLARWKIERLEGR